MARVMGSVGVLGGWMACAGCAPGPQASPATPSPTEAGHAAAARTGEGELPNASLPPNAATTGAGASTAGTTNPEPSGAAAPGAPTHGADSRPALNSCAAVGPMACAPPPSPHADLCRSSGPCILSRVSEPSHFEGLGFGCDPEGPARAPDPAFTAAQSAPEGAGLRALRLMNAVAEDGVGMIQFGATYLVAELAHGSCLVDLVHEWDARPSYVETDLATRWERSGAGFRLFLQSRRVLHEPLDEPESAAGTSDVRSDVCASLSYDVVEGRFTRIEQRSTRGACAGK